MHMTWALLENGFFIVVHETCFQSCVTEGHLYDGAVMITASHLPSHRNGFKFFSKAGGLNKQNIAEVRENGESTSSDRPLRAV